MRDARSFDAGSPIRVEDGTVTFAPDPECPNQEAAGEGVYGFTVERDTLTFRADHDTCADRTETLVTHPGVRRR